MFARPSISYFLVDHIGVGVLAGGSLTGAAVPVSEVYGSVDLRDREALVGAHALLELPLGERLGLLLRPSLSYAWSERVVMDWSRTPRSGSNFDTGGSGASLELRAVRNQLEFASSYVRGALFLPLVVALSQRVVVGLGPEVWFDVLIKQEPKLYRSEPVDGNFASRPRTLHEPARTRVFVGATTWIGASF